MSVLSIFSLLLQTLLHPASAPGKAGPQRGNSELFALWLLSCWANGKHLSGEWGVGQEESEVGVFIPLVPSPPGCHGCLPAFTLWVPLATPWGRCRRAGVVQAPSSSQPGYCSTHIAFLNPTHTFVNIPLHQFTSVYPIGVCHLFPTRVLTIRSSFSLESTQNDRWHE